MKITDLLDAGYSATAKVEIKKPGLYLWGEFMHGDADQYTKESTLIPSVEILDVLLMVLDYVKSTRNYRLEKRDKKDREEYFYSIAGEKWISEYLYDHFVDWWPSDVTCDDYKASLENYWVTFVDETGLEYNVQKI